MGRKVTEERGLRRFIKRKKKKKRLSNVGGRLETIIFLHPFSLLKEKEVRKGAGPAVELPAEVWREALTRQRNQG